MCGWLGWSQHDDHTSLTHYIGYINCRVSIICRSRSVSTSNSMVQGPSRASVTSLSAVILVRGMREPSWVLNVRRNPNFFKLNHSLIWVWCWLQLVGSEGQITARCEPWILERDLEDCRSLFLVGNDSLRCAFEISFEMSIFEDSPYRASAVGMSGVILICWRRDCIWDPSSYCSASLVDMGKPWRALTQRCPPLMVYDGYSWCTAEGDSKRCAQRREQTKVTFWVGEILCTDHVESLDP